MRVNIGIAASVVASTISTWPPIQPYDAVDCVQNQHGALLITKDCLDPDYASIIIDNETDADDPVPHHRVSGHFNGTDTDFNLYFPPPHQWKGRFFQLVYPSQNSTADDNEIEFGVESGGVTVHGAGTTGYRADAALAKFTRQLAREYYKISSEKIHGYVYGGSGGSLKTVGAAENTFGVWDGCVVLIQAVPMSIPYNWNMRSLGGLILAQHKDEIISAVQPGGSGDPYRGLDKVEKDVLREISALGIPPRGWEDWEAIAGNSTQLWQTMKDIAVPMIQDMDSTYVDDFWAKQGYAGSEKGALGDRFRDALIEFNSTIHSVNVGEDRLVSEFVLENLPTHAADAVGLGFSVMVNGTQRWFSGTLDFSSRTVYILAGAAEVTLAALTQGENIIVDNRWFLAAHTYHRHQLPQSQGGWYAHDCLRHGNGSAIYPQRAIVAGPLISQSSAGGGLHSGNITMKTIVMDNLLDFDALPWHADWYKDQVEKAKGSLDDHFRLYYNDNADHLMGHLSAPITRRVVDFTGLYQQHLRDLVLWEEEGIVPPQPTNYTIEGGQVSVPPSATDRRGIQPVVKARIAGGDHIQVTAGQRVEIRVEAQVPTNVGQIVKVEFDPLGTGDFSSQSITVGAEVELSFSFAYATPGVYFAGVRVASHREGDVNTNIALAWNLDRVKVEVLP
ncbi:unnamed protein product [Clonostachys solani]|uniref:Uncharacterized protein n=1 Tax=Clonostachys solani TaxID=160281 RepID=A0A9N9WBK4_9HYPO|nr:unnamed protein product [Clonostachys solani]